ncbi:LOW QUALITY PROTEIN: hypothetical protein CFOL_v3_24303 [Cephalotus follicularis]|uniref:Protein SCAR n=1 Tax=Cephalotus follicularis TaxID=3775 RepID=A0A1Q3CL65_CEPFO|nr:LOW QUALITY PROTEIN: hypothetical protein CFOL_v3_24303 [Cephalotus follicularis]
MPLARYQIRNEYSLADPELYRAADRDDPEAILEGVAMAGLVGVLRQLGDLAEFAAEIFHVLHEEVMVTAARGHGLVVRVQQLEAEFPSIEKTILSQTNHSSFFSNAGIDWHPNIRTEQNLLTRGDLPHCIMDSYEESRGPPRLFLLDKFDVAGAGACLKRYTDPSFFKAEPVSSEIATVEAHREKKVRRAKKKGSRWRNGGTPEFLPTSHPKLHQLFLEERVENGISDPACRVKLKKRQLNRSLLDSKSGKSYMEKFLGTLSPEHKVVREIPATEPLLKLTQDSYSESGLDIIEISTVSPLKKSFRGKQSPYSSPIALVVVEPPMEELNGDTINREIGKVCEPTVNGETDKLPPSLPNVMVEKELTVDGEDYAEGTVDGEQSDDVTSEVDSYMDALATMESEMDADNEYRPKSNLGFLNVKTQETDFDANEEQLEVEAQISDSQSIENSFMSDGGNSSFKKGWSSLSYSDTLSHLAENTPFDGEAAVKVLPSTESCMAEIVDQPSNQLPQSEMIPDTKSPELVRDSDMSIDEDETTDLEVPCSSCLTDTNSFYLPLDHGANSLVISSVGPALDETPSDSTEFGSRVSNIIADRTNVVDSSAGVSAIPSQTDDCLFMDFAESNCLDELDVEASNLISDPVLSPVKKCSEVLQTDHRYGTCAEIEGKTVLLQSIISTTEDQFPCSPLPAEELCSGITLVAYSSDVTSPDDLVSMGDSRVATDIYSESFIPMADSSEAHSSNKQQFLDIKDDFPLVELDSKGGVPYSEENGNPDKSSRLKDEETDVALSAAAAVTGTSADVDDFVCPSPNLISSPSGRALNLQKSLSDAVDLNHEGLEFGDAFSRKCLAETEAEKEPNPLEVDATESDSFHCKPSSYGYSNYVLLDEVHDSSEPQQPQNSSLVSDVITAPAPAELNNPDLESESLPQSHLSDNGEDVLSSTTCYLPQHRIILEQSFNLQADQVEVEGCQAEESSSKSSMLWPDQDQPLNHRNLERFFVASSESCPVDFSSQPLSPEFLPQSSGQEVDCTKQAMDSFVFVLPTFGMLPNAAQVGASEMPPLPPLPPMQWRMGKVQRAPLVMQEELVDQIQQCIPSIPPFTAVENAQFANVAPHVSEQLVVHDVQPTPLSSQLLGQHDSLDVAGAQSLNKFLTLPATSNERPEEGLLPFESQMTQPSSIPLSSVSTAQHTASGHDAVSSQENLILPLSQSTPETDLEAKSLHQAPQNSEGQPDNSFARSLSPPANVEEQSQHDLLTSEEQTERPSNSLALAPTFEVEKPTGNPAGKLPRPRSPLVDALAAHDKRMLRKVTERVWPQVEPKVDERDSLLEQIRTKSFNLKPAMLTRPSIQGPTTNSKVAAILEKANAIRQAFAGSDEDDADSWSDS